MHSGSESEPPRTLSPGMRLGPYEVVDSIGAGGMGQVYRARDTRLNRTVAIKVLPPALAGDPEFRARFAREARTISALEHPHICPLYDVGEHAGLAYLVMQYLEGETLAGWISRKAAGPGGLQHVREAVQIAIQVATALDKAHRQGIVHRDLKPGNVILTRTGAKLLDFGLATDRTAPEAPSESALAATVAAPTARGTILGTFQYMAPEQIEGQQADARSDLFAFGVVLYEMLTGTAPFEGGTPASVMGAILKSEPPPVSARRPVTPAALDHVVRSCLAKDPAERVQTAHDIVLQLRWILEQLSRPEAADRPVASGRRGVWLAGTAGAVALLALVLLLVARSRDAAQPQAVRRFSIEATGTEDLGAPVGLLAVSSDAGAIVYASWREGRPGPLFLRRLDRFESTPVTGTDGATAPFFSPDGEWIGFLAGRQIRKIAVAGGVVLTIAEAPSGAQTPVWLPDDTILVPTPTGLWNVAAAGGALTRLTAGSLGSERQSFGTSSLLPDGGTLLTAVAPASGNWNDAAVVALRLETGERTPLLEGGYSPQPLGGSHLAFVRSGALLAVPFDTARLKVTGAPVTLVDQIVASAATGNVVLSVTADGTLVYAPGGPPQPATRRLVWVDRAGVVTPALPMLRAFEHPRLSKDGRRAVVGTRDAGGELWLADLQEGTLQPLTFAKTESESAVWGADGDWVFFAATRGTSRLTVGTLDSNPDEQALVDHGSVLHHHLGDVSPDGTRILLSSTDLTGGWDLQVLDVAARKLEPLLQTAHSEQSPVFSPDGRWFAYASDESGQFEVYVQPFPGPGGKRRVSADGGTEPRWSPRGGELFFRRGHAMLAVPIALEPPFSAGTPRELFRGAFDRISWNERNYDVTGDGSRFLMILREGEPEPSPKLHVVLNWFEEIRTRLRE